ncbi:3-oxoadipate enol-lactonase [Yinghuangia seranimata]|uniref:3-oxoadipate enol-lactonase n=1 Tax=Yinghuangia seranimata TaxID=408067 RepID=UPI00248BF87F|nr:3-oxoadipate enol-lactonase [Yinghuangia seranimata]MDI2130256.1 3-oxoadipate enol-lactonase [Yinghuangia seranimata]
MTAALNHRVDGPDDGSPDAPVLVLGAPLGADMRVWDRLLPTLTATHRVVRFDTRGHGASPLPPGSPTMSDLAADVLALLDGLGVARFRYAGISLAGAVGLTLALDAPDRLDRLVVLCSGARLGEPEAWHERAALVRAEGMDAVAETVLGRWYTPEFASREPETAADTLAMLRAASPEGYAASCEAIVGYDVRDRLADIRTPTLVVAAGRDPSTPLPLPTEVAAGVPGARLEVVEDSAHLVIVEAAEAVRPLLTDFLT